MNAFMPDRLILGHNQFYGINHLSAGRGAQTAQHFSNIDNVMSIIRHAYAQGATGMMMSTHPRGKDIAEAIGKDPVLSKNLGIYILMPYMAKYVVMANERGLVNMVFEILKSADWSEKLRIGLKGGVGMVRQDPYSMLSTLIDIELLPYKHLNLKAVFMHNTLTDLATGLGMGEVMKLFHSYIPERYGVSSAFCTLTSGRTLKYLHGLGIENPLMMAPFNPVGFQMSPSREECERTLKDIPSRMIAMSVLAAGHVRPQQAKEYLSGLPISSVIAGASSKAHIEESFKLFSGLWPESGKA